MDDGILTLTHATERDIDLLLVEELRCSPVFVRWVAERVWPGMRIMDSEVLHSKRRTHTRREIDICLNLETEGGASRTILIENKLDAFDQVKQAESYREEARLLVAQGRATAASILLTCPAEYRFENPVFADKFDSVLTYEEISRFLQERAGREHSPELAARLRHRHSLLEQAIGKKRRGYEAIPVAVIGDFNSDYVAVCREHFPDLKPSPSMLKPASPGESVTMIFASDTLPKAEWLPQTRLVHQLREANANINFYGWGDAFEAIALDFRADLQGTGYSLSATINRRKGGRSGLMVCMATPKVDNQQPFADQQEAIIKGMRAADGLRQWFHGNQRLLRRWSERLAACSG